MRVYRACRAPYRKEIVMKKILFSVLIALVSFSCVQHIEPTPVPQGQVEVGFVVDIPDAAPMTRAIDTDVENIDLLIFNESGNFLERIKIPGSDITGTGSQKRFSARLDISNNARTIYVIANGRTSADVDRINFSSITANMAQATAIPGLQTTILGTDMLPLVMWGRRQVASITSSVTISNLRLLRSTAVVEVKVGTGLTQFTLTQFTLTGVRPTGYVAPTAYTAEAAVPAAARETAAALINYHTQGTPYWGTTTTPLYAYDRVSTATDMPYVIVRGAYSGTDGYYKIRMVNGTTPYSIIRNHKYIVTITDVNGPGYATIADAIANDPMNIRANIVDQRGDITIMAVDGQHELGISNNTVLVQGANTTATLTIAKVYSSRTAAPTITTSGTVVLSNIALSAPTGTDQIRNLTARYSTAGTGTITITSGTLKHTITVTTRAITTGATSTSNSLHYLQLVNNVNDPWQVDITDGAYAWLHETNNMAAGFPGGTATTWGLQGMRSNNFGSSVLYFNQTQAVKGTVKYTYMNGTNNIISWLIFNK